MLWLIATAIALGGGPEAPKRSPSVKAEFRRMYACPSTAKFTGPCPGYEIDHRTPLCIGGDDSTDNLFWITVEDHKRKTRSDARLCRSKTP